MPQRRRRVHAASWVAAMIAGAAMLGEARAEPVRFPLNDPAQMKTGSFFALVTLDNQSSGARAERDRRALAQVVGPADTVRALIAGIPRDDLARLVTTAILAQIDQTLQVAGTRMLYRSRGASAIASALNSSLTNLPRVQGTLRNVPLPVAMGANRLQLAMALEEMRIRSAPPRLAKRYELAAPETCPVTPGPINLAQRGFAFEATRAGKILLFGIVGESRVFAAANIQRFMTLETVAGGIPKARIPDAAAPLFMGRLNNRSIELGSAGSPDCSLVLALP